MKGGDMPPKAAPKDKTKDKTKAAPKGPDFKLKAVTALVEDDEGNKIVAPNPTRSRTVSREEIVANLKAIQDTPNEWFEIAHYSARAGTEEKPGGARKVVNDFVIGKLVAPEGDGEYEVDWRAANYDGSDRVGSVIIAVYITE